MKTRRQGNAIVLTAVSYTHLDVYKRQHLMMSSISIKKNPKEA
ncbi:hypothetical protein [Enterococcus sp. 3H8_DIV0648]|nr:hypothetical protein [Enterococcus sp. 3H8_DIV0648]OTO14945.1 hypothetical protein A5875_004102 [Enterococcus sp. 3H8_DIV0648]